MDFKGNKIRFTTYFGEEVKPSFPCHKSLQHIKEDYVYERDTGKQNSAAVSSPSSSCFASLLDVSGGNCRRDLVDESGMIGNQIWKWSRCKSRLVLPLHKVTDKNNSYFAH